MTKKIIFSGGGTGGHIFPAINLMKHFFNKKYEVLLITDERGNKFIKKNSELNVRIINAYTPTNKNFLIKIFSYFLITYSIIKSIIILRKERPDLIIGFGGYVSFPISYASRFFKIPLIIYENNIVVGRTNKYLIPFAKKVLMSKKIINSFHEKYKNKVFEVGSILSKDVINLSPIKNKNESNKNSILILGGSQGAEIFGNIIPEVIKKIKEKGYNIEVNQQCTSSQKSSIIDFYRKNKIKNNVFEFNENVSNLFLSSNLAITRCGASTTAELVETLTPFIAIPLPNSIDNHQYLNAKYYENRGCCWFLDQNDFNEQNLINLIIEIIKNKNKLENVREKMKENNSKNVYSNIENAIKEFI